jgi:hypothetical protein
VVNQSVTEALAAALAPLFGGTGELAWAEVETRKVNPSVNSDNEAEAWAIALPVRSLPAE